MSSAIALSRSTFEVARQRRNDMLGSAIVFACAAALIFAGQPLPF
jgi:hypothetical protein